MASFDLIIDMKSLDGLLAGLGKDVEGKLILGIRKGLNILLQELKKNTPEDTKEMLRSYKVIDVTRVGNNFVGVIGNTADHSIFVEFGVDGRIYNYHKPKGSKFYSGVGNRTFQRSMVLAQDKIYQAIRDSLG